MRYLALFLILALAGCNGSLSGPSEQELLAIEQQRCRVAAIFAIAKPYQLANESSDDDYRGPPRAVSSAPVVTPIAANSIDIYPTLETARAAAADEGKRLAILLASDDAQNWLRDVLRNEAVRTAASSWIVHVATPGEWGVDRDRALILDPPETGEVEAIPAPLLPSGVALILDPPENPIQFPDLEELIP